MFPKCNPFDKGCNRHRAIDMTVYYFDSRVDPGEGMGFVLAEWGEGEDRDAKEVGAIPVRDGFQGARGFSEGVTLNWNQLALRSNWWREGGQSRGGERKNGH